MLRKSIMFFVIVGIFVITTNAHAALNAYMYILGEKMGRVKRNCVRKGREDSIIVYAFEQMTRVEDGCYDQCYGQKECRPDRRYEGG